MYKISREVALKACWAVVFLSLIGLFINNWVELNEEKEQQYTAAQIEVKAVRERVWANIIIAQSSTQNLAGLSDSYAAVRNSLELYHPSVALGYSGVQAYILGPCTAKSERLLPDAPLVSLQLPGESSTQNCAQAVSVQPTAQTIVVEQDSKMKLEYVRLSNRPEHHYIMDDIALSSDWHLLTFVPIDERFDAIVDDYLETLFGFMLILAVGVVADRLIRYHYTVKRLTYVDTLSGLYNRMHLSEFSLLQIELHDRNRLKHLGLILLDIDKFKSINDSLGHAVGDKVIARVAEILKQCSRASDLSYRVGGEEFMLLCAGESRAGLVNLAERLRHAIAEDTELLKLVGSEVTISLGVTEHKRGENYEQVFSRADALLYQAKAAGRNCTVSQLPDLDEGTPLAA